MEIAQYFLHDFNSIPRTTASETKRALNALFARYSALKDNEAALKAITSQFSSRNEFHVEFFIRFKRFNDLFEEFVKAGPFTKRISREKWFFEKLFHDFNADLGSFSYRIRLKILNQLPNYKSEQQCDLLFDQIMKIYGIWTAKLILHGCSTQKIRSVMEEYSVRFNSDQLVKIFDKNHEILLQCERKEDFSSPAVRYIARKSPEIFCKLQEKFSFDIKLNKRITTGLIVANKEEILKQPEQFVKILHPAAVVHNLPEIFVKTLPQENNPSVIAKILKNFPKKYRYDLFKLARLDEKIQDHGIVLDLISNPDERQNYAKSTYDKTQEDRLLKYYKPDNCFDFITKEKLKFTRYGYQRAALVSILFDNCVINDDYSSMLKVLDLVAVRLKNDDTYSTIQIFQSLIWSKLDFKRFTSRHWKYIIEIWSKPSLQENNDHVCKELWFKYLEFLIRNNLNVKNETIQFFKQRDCALFLQHSGDPKTVAVFYQNLLEIGPELVETDLDVFYCELAKNMRGSRRVEVDPRVVGAIRRAFLDEVRINNETFESLARLSAATNNKELAILYASNARAKPDVRLSEWFLKNVDISESYANFFERILASRNLKLVSLVKLTNLAKTFSDYCISKMQQSEDKGFLGEALGFMQSSEDYLAHPAEDLSLKYLPPEVSLPHILQLCKNEAKIKPNLGVIFSAFYRLPQRKSKIFLNELCERPELRKFGFYLICEICDKTTIVASLKACILKESSRITFKYFAKNPSEENWRLFLEKLKNHEGSLNVFIKTAVPVQYRQKIFEEILDVCTNKQKNSLLEKIDPKLMSLEFFQKILRDIFVVENVTSATSSFLIHGKDEKRFDDVIGKLRELKENFCRDSRRKLSKFVQNFCETYLKSEVVDESLIEKLLAKFQFVFEPAEAIEEVLLLTIVKFKNQNVENFSRSILEVFRNFSGVYGEYAVEIFAEVLRKLLGLMCDNQWKFYASLVKFRKSVEDVLLVVKLIPPEKEPEDENLEVYKDTLREIQSFDSDPVKLHLNLLLCKLTNIVF